LAKFNYRSTKVSETPLNSITVYISENLSVFVTVSFFIFWLAFGTWFACVYEDFDVFKAFYFIISGLSGTGNIAPACEGSSLYNCSVLNGYFWGSYILIGLPLYDANLGILAYMCVQGYIVNKNRKLLLMPWTTAEFNHAKQLSNLTSLTEDSKLTPQSTIDFRDFAIHSLMRMGQLDDELLSALKDLYCAIDRDTRGEISFDNLNAMNSVDFAVSC
jgi:hypothetical protein